MIDNTIGGPNFGFMRDSSDIIILDGDYKDTIYSYEEVDMNNGAISFKINPKSFYYKGEYINLDTHNISREDVKVFIDDVAAKVLKNILKMHCMAASANSNVAVK